MANVEKGDMSPAVKLFNNKVVEEQIKRPEGQVDMLIGLHAATLFPTMENSEQDVMGMTSQALHFISDACCKIMKSTNHEMSAKDEEM